MLVAKHILDKIKQVICVNVLMMVDKVQKDGKHFDEILLTLSNKAMD